ncbi:MAG TPA: hypothetical protein DCG75_06130 [Bacteroidales bacterium]|nr:hypothetical protein [Bacteroidales bacterium]
MPRNDKTGPLGLGPLTGRGMGNCARNTNLESNSRFGFGRGMRNGNGRAYGRNLNSPVNQNFSTKDAIETEMIAIKEQLSFLEEKLKNLS